MTIKNSADVELFERLERQLHVFYKEISALSKKKANDGVNKFKLAFVNNCLKEANGLIGCPLEGFEAFDYELLPTNSDVAMVLGQYVSAVYAFRQGNTRQVHNEWHWMVDGEPDAKTRAPMYMQYKED
jgi:hypothetical protein